MNHQNNSSLLILGIDPGTRISGFGLIRKDGSSLSPVDYGCIRPPPTKTLTERYEILFDGIDALIERYQPHEMAVETQYVQKNIQSAIKLGMARGIIIIAARKKGIPVFEYSPAKAKKAVVGNGRASKQQVQGMIRMRLQLSKIPEPEDAADALALAVCHAQARQLGFTLQEL